MKAFVAAVVLCLLVGSAVAQLPICDPNGTPLPVSNFRMTDNKYDKDSKQTRERRHRAAAGRVWVRVTVCPVTPPVTTC
jgi:hypothetical protein